MKRLNSHVISNGTSLFIRAAIPATPESLLLLIHGTTYSSLPVWDLGNHSTLDAFAAAGIATFALDLEGYGSSESRARLSTKEDHVGDIEIVCQFLRREFPNLPLVLLGWSWGGQLAALAAVKKLADGAILYGTYWGGGRKGWPTVLGNLA